MQSSKNGVALPRDQSIYSSLKWLNNSRYHVRLFRRFGKRKCLDMISNKLKSPARMPVRVERMEFSARIQFAGPCYTSQTCRRGQAQ